MAQVNTSLIEKIVLEAVNKKQLALAEAIKESVRRAADAAGADPEMRRKSDVLNNIKTVEV